MDSILKAKVVCTNCKWNGIVDECESDVDNEGSLGCPECKFVVEELSNIIDELLEYRQFEEFEEIKTNDADVINIYKGEVHITNNHVLDSLNIDEINDVIIEQLAKHGLYL